MNDTISRHGVSAWLDNMGYPRLADAIMDEKSFPSAQPETAERTAEKAQNVSDSDLISRKAAIDAIRASTSKYTGFMEMEMYTDDDAVEAIEALPPAQPERKRGTWIDYVNSHCECSVCHTEWSYFQNETEHFEFCPNCGADMREVDDERHD